jgi:hypothetical protein
MSSVDVHTARKGVVKRKRKCLYSYFSGFLILCSIHGFFYDWVFFDILLY